MENSLGQDNEQRNTLADTVYEKLLESILSGQLMPGAVVSEVALAKKLDVSRTPVHDALRQLSKDGLVEQQPGKRAVIATFSHDDIYDIFEMRKILEPEATRRASSRLDKHSLARLRSTAEMLAADLQKPNWVELWTDFDEDFHDAIARASGSPRLAQDINRYRLLHRGFNKLTTTVDVLQQALQEHIRILDALESRDAEAAALAMLEHVQEWQAYFVNHFPSG